MVPVTLNRMVFVPGQSLASSMAARSVPGPESSVLVTVMFGAQTVTVNVQSFVPARLVAVQVTVVTPTANVVPEGGAQRMSGAGVPVAVGSGQVTATMLVALATLVMTLPGHKVNAGGAVCASKAPMSSCPLTTRGKPGPR